VHPLRAVFPLDRRRNDRVFLKEPLDIDAASVYTA
jgi:hypothetical protein